MMLKNIMEDKKLNLSQPLLSVRKYSPAMTDQKKIEDFVPVIHRNRPCRSELKSGSFRNPAAVPFQWEKTPGRPKEAAAKQQQIQNRDRPLTCTKLPPGKDPNKANRPSDSYQVYPRESHVFPYLDEKIKDPANLEDNKSCELEDHHYEAYVDTVHTLSRTLSYFLNCSSSELSGLDDLDANQSGCSPSDPRTGELVIDRFHASAKEVTPEYATKKELVVREQPQQLKKIVHQERPFLHYNENEEYKPNYENDQHGNFSPVCGLLPWFSLGLLNSGPCLRRTRVAISPANQVQTSSSSGSQRETDIESNSDIFELKQDEQIRRVELEESKSSSLRSESGELEDCHALTYHDAPITSFKENDGIGISEGMLHERIKGSQSSRGKGFRTFGELLADDQDKLEELGSGGSVVEKTLYVDTIHKVESPSMSDDDHEIISIRRIDQMQVTDSSIDFTKLDTLDGEVKMISDAYGSGNFSVIPSFDKSNRKQGFKMPKPFIENQDLSAIENTHVTGEEATENSEMWLARAITLDNSCIRNQFPVLPPLPKSPSDSWLWRTLPSLPIKNVSVRSRYLGKATSPQNRGPKSPISNAKYEAMINSTKMHRLNSQYSEELLTTVPEA